MYIQYYYKYSLIKKLFIPHSFMSFSSLAKEFMKSLKPIMKNVTDAIDFRITSGTKVEMDPPARAPIKLANIRAVADPKKTANGLLEVPLIVSVANCVLSPNSAINIVKNVDKSKFKIIYMYVSIIS